MSSLPLWTLNSLSSVALRSEFCPLKSSHGSKYLPIGEESFLPSGYERSENLLFPLGRTGVFRKTPLLPIPKRGVEV
jgi:hypothetical protein